MKLNTADFPFVLLTPAMIGGAKGKSADAEMRVASIRGQVRWWHRAAHLSPSANEVWGQTDPTVIASRVSLSLGTGLAPQHARAAILPHDLRKSGKPRDAIAAGETFSLRLTRLVGCSTAHWEAAQTAMKIWLLLGGLGLRVNRAAGSVWPTDSWVPCDEASLRHMLIGLGYSHPLQLVDDSVLAHPSLSNEPTPALKLRHAASNTVSVARYFGQVGPRQPSPLKMKIILLGSNFRLLLTSNRLLLADFVAARKALGPTKPLGHSPWK